MTRALETTFDVTNSFYVTAIANAEKGEVDEIQTPLVNAVIVFVRHNSVNYLWTPGVDFRHVKL